MPAIRLRPGDKFLIAGQNGSGKSVLGTAVGRGLAGSYPSLVVYDPKDDPEALLPNMAIVTSADDAIRALPGHVLYRPSSVDMADVVANWDRICAKIIDLSKRGAGGAGFVVHELGDLGTSFAMGPAFAEVYRKGRSLAITVVGVTQRPVGIPVLVRSESQHVACFTLVDDSDRDTMARLMGPAIRPRPLPLDHTFWYRGPDLRLRRCAPVGWTGGSREQVDPTDR